MATTAQDTPKDDGTASDQDITVTCLCKSISIDINAPSLYSSPNGHICHCLNCRKFSSSCGLSVLMLKTSQVQLHDPKSLLKTYLDQDTDSGRAVPRAFCSNCGCPIGAFPNSIDPRMSAVSLGLFEKMPEPEFEVYVKDRPEWCKASAIHDQWLYGASAVQRCLDIWKVLRANARIIRFDLAKAKEVFDAHVKYARRLDDFPHVTSCLMATASHVDYPKNIHLLPPDTRLDQIDNDDGITVFDVTNPDEPRYCFVRFDEVGFSPNVSDSEDDSPVRARKQARRAAAPEPWMPWTATEHLMAYREDDDYIANQVDALPMIDADALNSAWGIDEFSSRPNTKQDTEAGAEEGTKQPAKTLREKSLSNVMSKAFESELSDLSWLAEAELLPDFHKALAEKMRAEPELMEKPAWFELLKRCTQDQQRIDLSPFDGLTSGQVGEIVTSASEYCTLLLPAMPQLGTKDILDLLAIQKISQLHFGPTKNLSLDDLLHAIDGKGLRRVTHPDLYKYPLTCIQEIERELYMQNMDQKRHMPHQWFPADVQSGYPLTQVVFLGHYYYGAKVSSRTDDGLGLAWSKEAQKLHADKWWSMSASPSLYVLPTADMLLSVEDIPSRLIEMVTPLARQSGFGTGGWTTAWNIRAIAMNSGLLHEKTLLPMAARMYISYKNMSMTNGGLPPPARPLEQGEWTIFVFQEEHLERRTTAVCTKVIADRWAEIRYGFVTLDADGQLKVCSLSDFLEAMKTSCPGQQTKTDADYFERVFSLPHEDFWGTMAKSRQPDLPSTIQTPQQYAAWLTPEQFRSEASLGMGVKDSGHTVESYAKELEASVERYRVIACNEEEIEEALGFVKLHNSMLQERLQDDSYDYANPVVVE